MGNDFGAMRRTPGERRVIALVVAASVVVFATPGALVLYASVASHHAVDQAETNTWTVSGPPCPTITADAWRALQISDPQPMAFRGVVAQRAHGDVSCEVQDTDGGRAVAPYTVCGFTAPFAIRLQASGGDIYYEPGVGQPATISLEGGRPRCVLAAAGA